MEHYSLLYLMLATVILWPQTKSVLATGVDETDGTIGDVFLMQTGLLKSRTVPDSLPQHHFPRTGDKASPLYEAQSVESKCADLTNHGSFFSTTVEVGTPPQSFDIVADTGSNAFIIPDCRCEIRGGCSTMDHCFSTQRSSTFYMETFWESGVQKTRVATLGYGSGDITCSIGSDHVKLGSSHTYMNNSVFLMESRRDLDIKGSFDGILGLGLPESQLSLDAPPFMKAAGIDRYSLCFNENEPGVLRMHIPELVNPMSNKGDVHWSLDLQGVSVGDTSTKVLFCDPATMNREMQTACRAIPDSGTTLMIGSPNQVQELFSAICDNWDRCRRAASEHPNLEKSMMFHSVLESCSTWMDDATPLDEMPSIKFHLAGAAGEKQEVELSAWSYVLKTRKPVLKKIRQKIFGDVNWGQYEVPAGSDEACTAAFSSHASKHNSDKGALWILGSPLFFESTVSYDITTKPARISIHPGVCSACVPGAKTDWNFLYSTPAKDGSGQKRSWLRRKVRQVPEVRWTSIDLDRV